jgi:DNA sulfur modification protein DndD
MIIKRLVFNDFLIFYDRQELTLGPGLFVIHGENGLGKSTFLNGIAWALLGQFRDRQDRPVADSGLLNHTARKEGQTEVSVELTLDVDGTDVLVRRTHDTTTGKTRLYVKRGNTPLNRADAEALLRGVLDRDVARFFLFDGEDLRRYEEMLQGDEAGALQVRRSIEHILGLPALTNAAQDLDEVAADFGAKATAASRKEGKAAQAVLRAEQLESALADARDDEQQLQQRLADANAEKEAANEVLQGYDAARDLMAQKAMIEAEIASLEQRQRETLDARQKALAETWRDVLAEAVAGPRQALRARLDVSSDRTRLLAQIDALEGSLEAHTCEQCGQDLKPDAAQKITEQLAGLRAALPNEESDEAAIQAALLALTAITPNGRLQDAVDEDQKVRRLERDITLFKQDRSDLVERVSEVPQDKIREAANRAESAIQIIGVIDAELADVAARIESIKSDLRAAQAEVSKASTDPESAAMRSKQELAQELAELFGSAISEFRDERRKQVGADASEIFKRLTTSPEYEGLIIDENYGLVTVGPDGDPVPGRSAGQEQIVAFALIGALNRNATRGAPVVMDTPLGRLDKRHRELVLTFLGDMADQVFLLVHSAELDDEDLDPIRDGVAAEYQMRKQAAFKTTIEPRQAS